ncbi:putative 4-hydroxy-4-methyl-2-oxoglutarate aldolase [Vibrio sp.]|uniref:4-hydroxy-4-methyl-2-oxoglutarate aldolase n=1 Tax=Vibrio viridaestus TaxID=2487322 RepID=A0A3N9TGG5_9VIBR|nr:putative 4-hydroxy-4-methyl-2-oxoglutarate aldolase [Vibrio viridaestus]MDC0609311.1 putative 4-hydroxy-4-methyl-2-oxoglutarate aldolase [Vibrio sp.]RQW62994.1 putative 4-hydroxy-4-methyl-2-oxoglutarate aldolase [Vibrio viridaestus]
MKDITTVICDKYNSDIQILDLPLHNFGYRSVFFGQVVTVSCFKDNAKVTELLSQDGKGKVLVVDGNGSSDVALFDDSLAAIAMKNNWEGVVIYGAVREVGALADRDLGIKAFAVCPKKSNNHDSGHVNITLRIANQSIQPGDYLYSDWNGIVLSPKELEI